MIISAILTIITSWIIVGWGIIMLRLFPPKKSNDAHLIILYLLGLSVLIFLSNVSSLFIGQGSSLIQIILLLPILDYRNINSRIISEWQRNFPVNKHIQMLTLLLLISLCVMHAWIINHPDTINYQNSLFEYSLFAKHPTGIIAQKNQYGYGGAWFSVAALFSYHFALKKIITFVNISLVAITILYLTKKIDDAIFEKDWIKGLCYLSALCIGTYEYTFFRLAITSVAPDTPAAIIGIFAVIYFLKPECKGWILSLACITAVTIKLSLGPILLLIPAHILRTKQMKEGLIMILITILVSTPFIVKNILSTGYILYPYSNGRVTQQDFTPTKEQVEEEADYIKAYARNVWTSRDPKDIKSIAQMDYKEWVPTWWQQQAWSSRIMMGGFILFIGLAFVSDIRAKKINWIQTSLYATIFIGVVFWWTNAPAVRFGSAFLLAPIFYFINKNRSHNSIVTAQNSALRVLFRVCLSLFIILTVCYLAYRIYYFCDAESILVPKGPLN